MASLPLGNHAARETSSPSLHNPMTQPNEPLTPTSGVANVAVTRLPSTTNPSPPHAPSKPVVTTRDSADVTSFEFLRLAADRGDAYAQYKLGRMYSKIFSVVQDYAKAIKYFRLAADQGHAESQYKLGVMYEEGCGVAKNGAEAAKYFQRAANQGHATAQWNLGRKYYERSGVAQSYDKAAMYYQLAADQGHKTAQWNLGSMYEDGLGVAKSYDKAVKYYQLAADQGVDSALRSLGQLYRDGKGVPLDPENAMRYFWKSGGTGNIVYLSCRGITDNLLQYLPKMFEEFGGYGQIKGLPSKLKLDLRLNPITDISAPSIALILKHTHTLTELSLEYTGITDQGKKIILHALSNYNVSVVSCLFNTTSLWTPDLVGQLTLQNQAIKIIMDELDKNYPTSIPKPFDILPMEVVRQLLQTIAVVNTKNPASSYHSIFTSVSSMLGYQHATTEQVMSEVYNILMSDFSSASHKGE